MLVRQGCLLEHAERTPTRAVTFPPLSGTEFDACCKSVRAFTFPRCPLALWCWGVDVFSAVPAQPHQLYRVDSGHAEGSEAHFQMPCILAGILVCILVCFLSSFALPAVKRKSIHFQRRPRSDNQFSFFWHNLLRTLQKRRLGWGSARHRPLLTSRPLSNTIVKDMSSFLITVTSCSPIHRIYEGCSDVSTCSEAERFCHWLGRLIFGPSTTYLPVSGFSVCQLLSCHYFSLLFRSTPAPEST